MPRRIACGEPHRAPTKDSSDAFQLGGLQRVEDGWQPLRREDAPKLRSQREPLGQQLAVIAAQHASHPPCSDFTDAAVF